MDKGLTVAETIDAVCQGLRQAQEEFGIVAKALVCGMRQSDQELTARILDEANEVGDSDFVGFDFAGDEHHYGPKAIKPLIEQVQSYNRPMTFHAGECGCPAFLAESIAWELSVMDMQRSWLKSLSFWKSLSKMVSQESYV